MSKHQGSGPYPLQLHMRYRVILGIGGLSVGEIITVTHLRDEMQPEGPRNIFVTVERAGGQQKEFKLNMGPGMAQAYFEKVSPN